MLADEKNAEGFSGRSKKGTPRMSRLRKVLDPMRTGKDAESLEKTLLKLVVGQEEAVEQIVNIYQMNVTGLTAPGRPVGNFLFLGPTGSGKTRTVEATAEALLNNPRAVIKIDCAEFQHSHEIAKLIGSPPGYLGHKETRALLSQEALDQHHTEKVKLSFVLFDEIEKASDALWNLLLGILDKATLTLGDNRRVDFSHTMIFMTSNLGAKEMDSILRPGMGFRMHDAAPAPDQSARLGSAGTEAARRRFSPEFINRIDRTVVFNPLGRQDLERILALELEAVVQRMRFATGAQSLNCNLDAAARNLLLAEGTDERYGARHLKRAVERLLVQPVASLIASGQLAAGDRLTVECDSGVKRLVFSKETPAISGSAAA
jgi:ATP-dependent Clp protease ATP-binding subunit ClpB